VPLQRGQAWGGSLEANQLLVPTPRGANLMISATPGSLSDVRRVSGGNVDLAVFRGALADA
jgi:hypothetical protein